MLVVARFIWLFVTLGTLFFGGGTTAFAAGPPQVSVVVQKSPAQITLTWPGDSGTNYNIYRTTTIGGYPGGTGSWDTVIATLPGSATFHTDTNIAAGVGYEYRVVAAGNTASNAYVYAGIELPLVENRGKLILLVDDSFTQQLAVELNRLQQDLTGDGWTVIRHEVSRTNSPANIKALIKADYNADPANVTAVFLLGHIPVPYSGNLNPDGHGLRPGPTDTYYGDMHGTWTDSTLNVDNSANHFLWWKNLIGDGKFDQTRIPADMDLQVGRVDFYDLPAFQALGFQEVDLLRRYLNKDHDFRTGAFTVANRGATMTSSTADYCMSEFFGATPSDEIAEDSYFSTFENNSYLWFAKGTGGGQYDYTAGIGATTNFAASASVKVVFNSFFASYFWEWDVTDSFLRAPLAAKGYSLVNLWSDNPCWILHHMALGKTIGYSARISQNNTNYYGSIGYPGLTVYRRGIHLSLMGDPTLRMHVVAPPANLTSTTDTSTRLVTLNWSASPERNLLGYHVYRAASDSGPFLRLNNSYVTNTTFTDTNVSTGPRTYMVRAVKLESSSGSGSYINASQGVFDEQGPRVLVADDVSATRVKVIFDKLVNPVSAQAADNYSLNNGVAVSRATLQADGRTVLLDTSAHADGLTYTLTLNNITDQLSPPHAIFSNTQVSYLYAEVKEYDSDSYTIALWHLNGDGSDASGNGHNLALNGNAQFAQASPVGATRQCLRVTGLDDFASAEIPAAEILAGDGKAFALEARIFVNAWTAYGVSDYDLVGAVQDYNAFFSYQQGIWDVPHNGAFIVYQGTVMDNPAAQTNIIAGQWTHIALVFDGTDKNSVYINKVLRAGPVTAAPFIGNPAPFKVTLGNFDGYIDEVRLSRVARNFTFERAAPTNLTASALSASQIDLNWADVPGAAEFQIERWQGDPVGFVQIAVTRAGTTSFRDTGLKAGTQYFYRVRAVSDASVTEYSNQANATTTSGASAGTPPKLVVRGYDSHGFIIHVDSTPGAPLVLEASTNLLNWVSILTVPQGGQLDFQDTAATNKSVRFYRAAQ